MQGIRWGVHLSGVLAKGGIPRQARSYGDGNPPCIHAVGGAVLCHTVPSLQQHCECVQVCCRELRQRLWSPTQLPVLRSKPIGSAFVQRSGCSVCVSIIGKDFWVSIALQSFQQVLGHEFDNQMFMKSRLLIHPLVAMTDNDTDCLRTTMSCHGGMVRGAPTWRGLLPAPLR